MPSTTASTCIRAASKLPTRLTPMRMCRPATLASVPSSQASLRSALCLLSTTASSTRTTTVPSSSYSTVTAHPLKGLPRVARSTASHTRTTAAALTFHRSNSSSTSTSPSPSSSSATSSTPAAPTSASPSSSQLSSDNLLTWDRYLHLRTIRRRYNLVFSAITAMGTTVAGAAVLSQQEIDNMGALSFGLDPVVVLGAATAACGAIGWLLGPFAGGAVFGLVYRRFASGMAVKEREFYQRIKRYRSDPAGQSMNNPVPDYYGEKITSVKDYRRWLKDQRAFRRKREGLPAKGTGFTL